MRSTAGSPTEPSFASKVAERSEQHEKIEKAKLASSTRSRPLQTSSLAPDFPPALAAQLVTITSPRDLLSAHIANNDRRLRRLLCRYTNQIQHGCKNLHCAVPSCLTCRQRRVKTPVRKYTDASARALAAHIIEEQGEKGLCHSDPVVPWFETPGSRPRTRSAEARPKANGHVKESANGHLVGPANGYCAHSSYKSPILNTSTKVDQGNQSDDLMKADGVHTWRRDSSGVQPDNTSPPRPLAKLGEREPVSLVRRDTKSFTQAIFDSLKLRSLWTTSTNHLDIVAPGPVPRPKDDRTEHGPQDSTILPNSPQQATFDTEENADEQPPEDSRTEPVPLTTGVGRCRTVFCDAETKPESGATADERDVKVAPLLTQDLLAIFARWQYLNLRHSHSPWPDQWLPEAYAAFLRNSMFFCLRDSTRTLNSIRDWHGSLRKIEMYNQNEFDRASVRQGVLGIVSIMPLSEIFRYLRLGLADAYNPPTNWRGTSVHRRTQQRRAQQDDDGDKNAFSSEPETYLSDEDTARICTFGLLLLECGIATLQHKASAMRSGQVSKIPLALVQTCHRFGSVFPAHRLSHLKDFVNSQALRDDGAETPTFREIVRSLTKLIEFFDDFDAKRLFLRITDLIAARQALGEVVKSRRKAYPSSKHLPTVAALIASHLMSYDKQSVKDTGGSMRIQATIMTIEWTRLLFARDWDGNAVIRRGSSLGGSLQLLMAMFTESRKLALDPAYFHCPLISDRLNMVEMPAEWLSFRADNKIVHLLSYPFLFEPSVLVTCFRAINYSRMSKAAVEARAVQKDVRDFTDSNRQPGANSLILTQNLLRPYMANNFVITVRRDNLLEDAVDQIWRRQRRELMRPLKVRMGMDEGEQGLDLGGVQQEFFRILFAQALNPEYAMFTIDERTRMTWFKPGSLEPLYKFEVLGVLMSLAVYNSITLPITFPIAFYRKLLGLKVKKLHQIADGWPELSTGLRRMLEWDNGDVSDVFARTYEFSYEAFGKHVNIDMKRFDKHTTWPPGERKKKEKTKTASFELPPGFETEPPTSTCLNRDCTTDDAPLVTNVDREQYIKDYIIWLTHRSIEQQYKSFAKGFYSCLDRTALSIFTPEALKAVIEGHTDIDISGLEAVTKYEDGFNASSTTIQHFWHTVRNFDTDQHRRLLEFVTASDRVPVNGISSVQFIIQRNGSGDERLPTSMTCFGRLLLPQYSSRQVLEEKLTKAIENSEGFGVA
jgi:hypothetical protein